MNEPDRTESVAASSFPDAPIRLLAPGTRIGDRYEVRRVLGSGGYAVVYLAFDRELRREVALKVLRADRMSPSSLRRLRREAAVARDAASPFLVRVFDIGSSEQAVYLIMEAVDGESLRECLTRGPLPIDSVGAAVVGFSSAVEGSAAIQATAATGGSETITIAFARGGLTASASPNPVAVNQPSTLSVTVTDGAGNPVPAGRTVTFSTSYPGFFTGNGASSTTSPSSVLTDATGRTRIWFTSSVTGTARITVESGSATAAVVPVEIYNPNSSLNVQITAGFVSGTSSSSTYELQAVVTNASGQPVAGEPVNFTTSRGTLSASRDTARSWP